MARLALQSVSKIYGQGEQAVAALRDVSLEFEPGELAAVVGPSGSGKTTLLAIAGALLPPTSGEVVLDDQSLSGYSRAQLTDLRLHKIGFVLQSSNLIPFLRVYDQLMLGPYLAGKVDRAAKQRAEALLEELGIAQRRRHYPEQLSGGERQRVAIAKALMNDPSVILADEPTASLDSGRGRKVVEMLARLVKESGKAGVMVTHDERMLDLCDRVYRIADGVLTTEQPVVQAR
jgi:putative ABC transport system ATP-binding protein